MKSKKKSAKRAKGRLLGISALAVLAYLCFGGDYNLYNLWRLKKTRIELHDQIKKRQLERGLLLEKIDRLQHDPSYIEEIAREKYSMVKPGEKVYRVVKRRDD